MIRLIEGELEGFKTISIRFGSKILLQSGPIHGPGF
jgi:hypothetical protein